MSDRPLLAKLATDALADEPVHAPAPSPAARRDAIALLAEALEARRRARTRLRVGLAVGAALAAAAAAVLVVKTRGANDAWTVSSPDGARIVHEGTTSSVADASKLVAGDRIVSGTVVLPTGTRVSVGASGEVALAAAGPTSLFDVRAGNARFDVAKLQGGQRFVVRTVDAEVEVRGTSFSVGVVPVDPACSPSPTRVVVQEGVVVVRHGGSELRLVAGDAWPKCTPSAAAASIATTAPPPSIAPSHPPVTPPSIKPSSSDLSAQNDVFAEGMAAKKRGDRGAALAAFERLLHKWPGSPLAESAAAERMRVATGAQQVSYAKAYLARWPHGFAREEAKSIVAGPSH